MPVLALPLVRAPVLQQSFFIPYLIASATTAVNTTTSKAVSVPAGTINGDVMIGVWDETTATGVTSADLPGSGWTLIQTVLPSTHRLRIYYKVALNEPASYTTTYSSGGPTWATEIFTFRDVDPLNPIDGTASTNTGASTTMTATGVTTANPFSMLFMVGHTVGSRSFSSSSLTEFIDTATGQGTFLDLAVAGGATGNKTATVSSSATWGAILVALRPRGGV